MIELNLLISEEKEDLCPTTHSPRMCMTGDDIQDDIQGRAGHLRYF